MPAASDEELGARTGRGCQRLALQAHAKAAGPRRTLCRAQLAFALLKAAAIISQEDGGRAGPLTRPPLPPPPPALLGALPLWYQMLPHFNFNH